jgi:protein involved in polysaccharide export with SLBB domain
MGKCLHKLSRQSSPRQALRAIALAFIPAVVSLALGGCQAVTNPVAEGIPVNRLPAEALGRSREGLRTIPLEYLRQNPPEYYQLDAGDILGVFIEGVLGERNQVPPVRYSDSVNLPPALGFPIPVREDGTISLPLIPPLRVKGMSIAEAQEAVRKAYTVTQEILQPGKERIIVTLMQPRVYHVLVVRQDSARSAGASASIPFSGGLVGGSGATAVSGQSRVGSAIALDLPAYKNDVLNALARSGGLPGTDAKNEVLIHHGPARRTNQGQAGGSCSMPPDLADIAANPDEHYVRIPLRLPPGAEIPFRPEEIILQNDDIVYIEARDADVFYTGGILLSGQYPLPRDTDLDVVQAITLVRGPLVNGLQSANNFTGTLSQTGLGSPNPSQVNVLRQVPGHGQINIRVDLNRALCDPRERILIQPKDIIILQQTWGEAFNQYFVTAFRYNFLGTILRQRDATAITTITGP